MAGTIVAMAQDFANASKRNDRAHTSLLLAEKLGWGQSVINKRYSFNRDFRSNGI